jgi:hypothetical protein
MTSRRQFFVRGAAATAAAFVPDVLLAAARQHSTPAPDLSTWSAVRSQFDLAPGWIHLSSFFIASHPRPVRDAIAAFRRALDANPYLEVEHRWFSEPPDNLQLAIRAEISPYPGAPEEIAFTRSTTEGFALVYAGLPLEPGDEVLTTTTTTTAARVHPLRLRAIAHARRIALYEDPAEATPTASCGACATRSVLTRVLDSRGCILLRVRCRSGRSPHGRGQLQARRTRSPADGGG